MMGSIGWVVAAAVAFVGTHFLLSHPLRSGVVARIGEKGFLGVYSLVAFATIIWLAMAYRAAPMTPMLWPVGDGLWAVVTVVMLVASLLLMGSLIGNPALPDPTGATPMPTEATGVFAITRHPMLWSFTIWGACHILVYPVAANIVVALSMIVLSLVGATMQDRKKEALTPDRWRAWEARTSYWPFAAMLAGRARIGRLRTHTLAGGVVVWLAATWAHLPIAGWPAGVWRWI